MTSLGSRARERGTLSDEVILSVSERARPHLQRTVFILAKAISTDQVVELMRALLRTEAQFNGTQYLFTIDGYALKPLNLGTLESIVATLNSFDELDETSVTVGNTFEVLVQHEQSAAARFRLRDGLTVEDQQAGLVYKLGSPSEPYAIALLLRIREIGGARALSTIQVLPPTHFYRLARQENTELEVFDVIKRSVRMFSLRISADSPLPKSSWKQHVDSFFFHLAYNLDMSLMPQRHVEELFRPSRISSVRRSSIRDLDAPRRFYLPDLVNHYQLGVSAESPMLEYISYYHVLEHWFENVFQDDLIARIQKKVTSPAFSYKRKKDVRDLIRDVSKAVQLRDEQMVINEQLALRLTLERYVDIGQLVNELDQFDPSLLIHYAENTVKFSDGDRVSFQAGDITAVRSALSGRIYKTRNAIVHSKEGGKGRFIPFTNDKELLPEIPLIRFIAEQIIIATSTLPS